MKLCAVIKSILSHSLQCYYQLLSNAFSLIYLGIIPHMMLNVWLG